MTIKFAIPKGSLEASTLHTLKKSWTYVNYKSRVYRVFLDDPGIEVKILRPQEIPNLVSDGLYDIGITGKDWINETKSDVDIVLDLEYGKIKLVFAIPNNTKFNTLDDMISSYNERKKILRISSEYLITTSEFIKQCSAYKNIYGFSSPLIVTPWIRFGDNKRVQIHLSFGATEAKPPDDVDAIVDATETGTTMQQNQLKIIHTILESSACLIVNKKSIKNKIKREKIFDMITLIKGAINSRKYLHIYINVKKENLQSLLNELQSLKKPTICSLSKKGWYGVNTVILKSNFYKLIPIIRKIAQGLVVHEPRQILELEA